MKKYLLVASIVCFAAPTAQAIDFSSAFNSAKDYLGKNAGDLLEKGKKFLSDTDAASEKNKETVSKPESMPNVAMPQIMTPCSIKAAKTKPAVPQPGVKPTPSVTAPLLLIKEAEKKAEEGKQVLEKEAMNLIKLKEKELSPAEKEALKKEALDLAKKNRDALINEANRIVKIDKDALRKKTYADFPVSRQQ